MPIHCPIGFADRPKTEVVGPTVHHLIELCHHRLMVQEGSIRSGFAADRLTDANHSLLGRNRAQVAETLGCQIVHGKATYGSSLAPETKSLLLGSDAMLGFLTRRDKAGEYWSTHRWVIEELASAFGQIPVVEVRESGVDPQSGMLAGIQRIQYCEEERDRCLIQIAQAISQIREKIEHRIFRLEPTEFTSLFRALLKKPGLRCSYRVMRRNTESDFCDAAISPVAGGLQMSIDGLRATDLI